MDVPAVRAAQLDQIAPGLVSQILQAGHFFLICHVLIFSLLLQVHGNEDLAALAAGGQVQGLLIPGGGDHVRDDLIQGSTPDSMIWATLRI